MHILIVEDERGVSDFLQQALQEAGYETATAARLLCGPSAWFTAGKEPLRILAMPGIYLHAATGAIVRGLFGGPIA